MLSGPPLNTAPVTQLKEIDKLAWLCVKDNRLAVVRSKGKSAFYVPGGKRDPGETDHQALIREIKEEVSVDLVRDTIKYAGTFKAQAHGKPEGTMVKTTCYFAGFTGELKVDSEIEEIKWVTYDDNTTECSAVTKMIMNWLKTNALKDEKQISKNIDLNKYEWVLFDADETLFHFDAFRGLKLMFSHYNTDFKESDYESYQKLNKSLWTEYQHGKITAETLKNQRFQLWADKLKVKPTELNTAFLKAMADICATLPGAVNLVETLKRANKKLGIITNGFTALQEIRLERTDLRKHFDLLVVSEQTGFAKPDLRIFKHALTNMGNPTPNKVLMIGDTLESDIQGGNSAGMDTCWLNASKKAPSPTIMPTYQVSSLQELESLLLIPSAADQKTLTIEQRKSRLVGNLINFFNHDTTEQKARLIANLCADYVGEEVTSPKSML